MHTDPECVGFDRVPQADVSACSVSVSEFGQDAKCRRHVLLGPLTLLKFVVELRNLPEFADDLDTVGWRFRALCSSNGNGGRHLG